MDKQTKSTKMFIEQQHETKGGWTSLFLANVPIAAAAAVVFGATVGVAAALISTISSNTTADYAAGCGDEALLGCAATNMHPNEDDVELMAEYAAVGGEDFSAHGKHPKKFEALKRSMSKFSLKRSVSGLFSKLSKSKSASLPNISKLPSQEKSKGGLFGFFKRKNSQVDDTQPKQTKRKSLISSPVAGSFENLGKISTTGPCLYLSSGVEDTQGSQQLLQGSSSDTSAMDHSASMNTHDDQTTTRTKSIELDGHSPGSSTRRVSSTTHTPLRPSKSHGNLMPCTTGAAEYGSKQSGSLAIHGHTHPGSKRPSTWLCNDDVSNGLSYGKRARLVRGLTLAKTGPKHPGIDDSPVDMNAAMEAVADSKG